MLGLLAFVFAISTDPFTDERTYLVTSGDMERGPGIVISCTPGRRPEWAVRIRSPRGLEAEFGGMANLLARVDDNPPLTLVARYGRRDAELDRYESGQFVESIGQGEELRLGLRTYEGERLDMIVPLDGASEAIGEAREMCQAR